MSYGRRGPPKEAAKDPLGRLALLCGAIFLFVVALRNDDSIVRSSSIVIGVLLLILFAFYYRIGGGDLSVGKFQIPLVDQQPPAPEQTPLPDELTKQASAHRPSLAEVREAAHRPASRRHRAG